jgi:hypothetical protein
MRKNCFKVLFFFLSEAHHGLEASEKKANQRQKCLSGKENRRTAAKRNKVLWEFFSMEENTTEAWPRAICHECGIFIKRNGASPTGMKQHLEREHVEAQKKYLQMLKDDKIEQVTYFE